MVGLALKAHFQLIRRGGKFGYIVWARPARGPRSCRRIERRWCADHEIDRQGRCRQQARHPYRGADPPRNLAWVSRRELALFAFSISCCEHSPGDLDSCSGGLIRREPPLRELPVDIHEVSAEHRDGSLAFVRAAPGSPYERPQESGQCHQDEQTGNGPEPDHQDSPSSCAARALSSRLNSGTGGSRRRSRARNSSKPPPPNTSAGGVSQSTQVSGAKGGSSNTKTPYRATM